MKSTALLPQDFHRSWKMRIQMKKRVAAMREPRVDRRTPGGMEGVGRAGVRIDL